MSKTKITYDSDFSGWLENKAILLTSDEFKAFLKKHPEIHEEALTLNTVHCCMNISFQAGSIYSCDYHDWTEIDESDVMFYSLYGLSVRQKISISILCEYAYNQGQVEKNQTKIGGLGNSLKTSNNALLDTSALIGGSLSLSIPGREISRDKLVGAANLIPDNICGICYHEKSNSINCSYPNCSGDLIPFDANAGRANV